MANVKVVFNPKESRQKDDCLFCDNQATLQAEANKGNISAAIRCCSDQKCKDEAEKSARDCIEKS